MTESYLSPLTSSDGVNIAVQDWPLYPGALSRGTVLLVHGLGEHAGRYHPLAEWLNRRGFAVRGHDQYGHGESGGERGALSHDDQLISDLADVVDDTRREMQPNEPLILLGHSLGGLVAADFVARKVRKVQALVLSSPAFDPGLTLVQKMLLATLPRIAPKLRVGNGVKPKYLSRDASVVKAYQNDPLVHDRISARLAKLIAMQGPACIAAAPGWTVPTLVLFAGQDKLVSPRGSRAFVAAAPAKWVQSQCFETMYHEIFNEPDRVKAYTALNQWFDSQFQ